MGVGVGVGVEAFFFKIIVGDDVGVDGGLVVIGVVAAVGELVGVEAG